MRFKLAGLVVLAGLVLAPQVQAKLVKISTVTASASASIQFTGLSATYNSYYLNCTGMIGSAAAGLNIVVGEGAGPTWETGANYTTQLLYTGNSDTQPNATDTTTGTNANDAGATNGSTTLPQTLSARIDNPGSTTITKRITFYQPMFIDTLGEYYITGAGYWNADTGAVTGVEIVPASGNIAAGTCTLYGLTS